MHQRFCHWQRLQNIETFWCLVAFYRNRPLGGDLEQATTRNFHNTIVQKYRVNLALELWPELNFYSVKHNQHPQMWTCLAYLERKTMDFLPATTFKHPVLQSRVSDCLFLGQTCLFYQHLISRWLVVICSSWTSCATSEKDRKDNHIHGLTSSKIRDKIKRSVVPWRVELSSYSVILPEIPTLYIPFIISDLFFTIAYVQHISWI